MEKVLVRLDSNPNFDIVYHACFFYVQLFWHVTMAADTILEERKTDVQRM